MALSADGNTALVGGPGDRTGDPFTGPVTGAVWVWTRTGGIWTQQGPKLVGSDAAGNSGQGASVALSADGSTALVGGPGDADEGAAWVWTRNGGIWTQQGPKLVGTGAVGTAKACQGFSVALSADGNTALVGGPCDDGPDSVGAVWVFTRTAGVWTQQGSKLVGTGGAFMQGQGVSVALSADGNTAMVGGSADDGVVGAVWAWTRSGGVWTQQGPKLVSVGWSDAHPGQGASVALSADGDTALVGGPIYESGGACAWTRKSGKWSQQGSVLVAWPDSDDASQGRAVALSADGNTALIGGPNDQDSAGAAWLWVRNGGVWRQKGPKLAGAANTSFGSSVAISADGTTALVGVSNQVWPSGWAGGGAWALVANPPVLHVATTHSGNFQPGAQNVTYQVTVSNAANAGPTAGLVTLTETLPSGLILVSMSGAGWTCTGGAAICTRSDVLNPGMSYPPVTVTVNVAADAVSPQLNTVRVSGGDSADSATTDSTTIGANPPVLGVVKSHAGSFWQGQHNATYQVVVMNTYGAGATAGPTTVTEAMPAGLILVSMTGTGWTCPGTAFNNCLRSDPLVGGASYPPIVVTVNVDADAPPQVTNQVSVSGGGSSGAIALDRTSIGCVCSYRLSSSSVWLSFSSAIGTFTITVSPGCSWTPVSNAPWLTLTSGWTGSGNGTIEYAVASNPSGTSRSATLSVGGQIFTVTQGGMPPSGPQALRFVPITPCRVADTRGPAGPFGGPGLVAAAARDFDVSGGVCAIPSNALAYSLNVTVALSGPLGFLSVWPAGLPQPVVSTLNSLDGRIRANAAIVPAGANGAITVLASHTTHAIIDINGYFVPAVGAQDLAFYPITPCRLADTRGGAGALGGPALTSGMWRVLPVTAGSCAIPAGARAYVFNMTAVPSGPLGFLSAWPTGSGQPDTSTLNAPTGAITSNMAIVPAGVGGSITVVATDTTHLVLDIMGYFAPPGTGSLNFYTTSPCRILDTRAAAGPFGGPSMSSGVERTIAVLSSGCGIPSTARAYSLNATVVPPSPLGFLTLWGSGAQPAVSTLNSLDGSIVANAALVAAGSNGVVTAVTTQGSHLILDINGYFR